jgi:hypothetical protein
MISLLVGQEDGNLWPKEQSNAHFVGIHPVAKGRTEQPVPAPRE